MADAIFRHGAPVMVDHTPGSAVSSGDIVVVGDGVRIAHIDIAASALGALAIEGGVYDVLKGTDSGDTFSAGEQVYWDAAASEATTTAAGNELLGIVVEDADADDTTVRVYHKQPGTAGSAASSSSASGS